MRGFIRLTKAVDGATDCAQNWCLCLRKLAFDRHLRLEVHPANRRTNDREDDACNAEDRCVDNDGNEFGNKDDRQVEYLVWELCHLRVNFVCISLLPIKCPCTSTDLLGCLAYSE
jgi:hypothetical protein